MKNKQTLVIILLIVGIIVSLIGSIGLSIHLTNNKDDEIPVETEKERNEEKEAEKDKTELSDDKKEENMKKQSIHETGLQYELIDESHKTIAPEHIVNTLVEKARMLFREFKFAEGAELLKTEGTDIYLDEGAGEILYDLNFQASLLSNLAPPPNVDFDGEYATDEGIDNILNRITDTELAFLGVMLLDHRIRGEYILNKESLNPIFDDVKIRILKKEEAKNEELFNRINNLYSNVEGVEQIHFNIDGNELYAYVLIFQDGRAKLYTIQEVVEGSTSYKSVSEWNKVYEKLENRF